MTRSPFHDDMTVAEAREVLRPLANDKGAPCPLCTQTVRVYPRAMTSVAARAVVALYEEHGREFAHMADVARKRLADVAHQGGYLVLSQHWGLIEEEKRRRPDGGRTGWWAVTALGEEWILGETGVPKYARVFDGRCLGQHGPLVTRTDVLGEGFDFGHLMRTHVDADDDVDMFLPPNLEDAA